jgi:hypothetical protein
LALTQDLAEIRETEFDEVGEYQDATLVIEGSAITLEVFVDRLGRVILPAQGNAVQFVSIPSGAVPRKVIRIENRYRGDRPITQVLYLETQGGEHGNS